MLKLDSENANSCIDSCGQRFDSKFKVNLEKGVFSNNADDLVEVLEGFESSGADSFECSKNSIISCFFFPSHFSRLDSNSLIL